MNKKILKRVINEANYIVKTGDTIREVARKFKVSKSTVHKDLQDRLPLINKEKFLSVDKILKYHLDIRHIRGGESTKRKYQKGE